jgi:antirestriction protein ArdC
MASVVPSKQFNVYSAIMAKIVRGIRKAKGRYEMPWHTGEVPFVVPTNALTDNPYRGVNILSHWLDASAKRYRSGYLSDGHAVS